MKTIPLGIFESRIYINKEYYNKLHQLGVIYLTLTQAQPRPRPRQLTTNREQTTETGLTLLKALRESPSHIAIGLLRNIPHDLLTQIKDTDLASTLLFLSSNRGQPRELQEEVASFVRAFGKEIGLYVREPRRYKNETAFGTHNPPIAEGLQ